MVRIGIAGLGFIGRMHLAVLRGLKGAEVVAVADRVPKNLSGGGSEGNIAIAGDTSLDGVATYDDAGQLLEDGNVDAVLLALPTYLHKEWTIRALEAGKHVFCEKPMALTSDEARAMADAAGQADTVFMVGHCIRYWPVYAMAHRLSTSGEYGAVRAAHFVRSGAKPTWAWENWLHDEARSGGAILDLHIHDVDFVNYLLGKPKDIAAAGIRTGDEGYEEVTALYRYGNGAYAAIEGGWANPPGFGFHMEFRIVLEGATLEFSSVGDGALHLFTKDGASETPELDPGDGYSNELADFLRCVETGDTPSVVTAQSSLEAVELVEQEKARLGG